MELGPGQLVPRLLADVDSPEGLPSDFIQELAARVDEEGFEQVRKNYIVTCNFLYTGLTIFLQIFGQALVGLAAQMRSKNILNDYLGPLNVCNFKC
jgi:hypothetical protein